jgi:DNA (cytosine-5)-methyltransferase 1
MQDPLFIIVDLFCGFGGTTTGFVDAELDGNKVCKVIACVNHDPKAIKSHWLNHPEVKHFEEDIRTLDLTELAMHVKNEQDRYPNAKLILWASLECTNFSKAKGGQPRDADSRTLADDLFRYQHILNPDYVKIENVVEFMSWGPLDENGKPLSRKNGQDWMRWKNEMCSFGYYDEWRELNSADFGAYTSRNRLFGCFAKHGLPIVWPEPSHSKKPQSGMFAALKKWMPVKEVLNFEDEGESIFSRKKPLSDKTLERIYAGLIKYVAKGDTSFISKYYSGKPADKNKDVNNPVGALTTIDHHSLVQGICLLKYNSTDKSGTHYPPDINAPCPVVTTQSRLGLIQGCFLASYYGNGHNLTSIESPAPTIPTKDRVAIVNPDFLVNYNHSSKSNDINEPAPTLLTRDKLAKVKPEYFIDKHFGAAQNQSIEQPAGSILPTDKHRLVQCDPFVMPTNYNNGLKSIEEPCPVITANRKHHYIVNPSHGGHSTSTEAPCPVIIARQDKAPLYLVQAENGTVAIAVFDCDTEIMISIKQFMSVYGLVDIKMRMLRVPELLKIQGFPANYQMVGNQSDHKKFIGNSVHPLVPKNWAEAMGRKLIDQYKMKVA